jgi:hypothetical protein
MAVFRRFDHVPSGAVERRPQERADSSGAGARRLCGGPSLYRGYLGIQAQERAASMQSQAPAVQERAVSV